MVQPWPIRPLLQDANDNLITNSAGWAVKADAIRATYLKTLGPRPASQRFGGMEVDTLSTGWPNFLHFAW